MEPLGARIVAEIENGGPIGFARFVELALYDPDGGFYARGGAGRRRDFITGPEVGPLFGGLVARAIDRWWEALGQPPRFDFVDVGAGPGTLARSVMRTPMRCAGALRYVAVERSESQRALHPADVESRASMPEAIRGAVFANELLDNLAFDLFDFDPGLGWREVRVGLADGGGLAEVLVESGPPLPVTTPDHACRVPRLTDATTWLADVLDRVESGVVTVVDYAIDGYPAAPGREWLRTFRSHERGDDPLVDPGSQDITIDVDIGQLGAVRPPAAVMTQADWLEGLGIAQLVEEGRDRWKQASTRPDVAALEGRSRIREAEALLDGSGLGGFTVAEWHI